MSALFEMRVRLGSDPRGFDEFVALRGELAKLSHPACPDVDWAKVEQLCRGLFEKNGAELQTVAAFTLARSHRYGLDGMTEGVALIEALGFAWTNVWPQVDSAKLDILNWLFTQLQALLRGLDLNAGRLQSLAHLELKLAGLNEILEREEQVPIVALSALRQQISSRINRMKQSVIACHSTPQLPANPEPTLVMPVVILPTPRLPDAGASAQKPKRHPTALWLSALLTIIALSCWLSWKIGVASSDIDANSRLLSVFQPRHVIPDAVRLDSLSLFDAGSAELKPDSNKSLIEALVSIKAQPGWLIVIAGHTDATGDAEQNLKISHSRASAVRDWMQRMGDIPANCFAVQGFGASQPVASNETEVGRSANRRVDIRLVPQAGACE
jgi:type VI secretion system protein VasL